MTTMSERRRPTLLNFCILFATWILLTQSFSLGNILLAAVLAYGILFFVGNLQEPTARVKKPVAAARYLLVLLYDIVVSNVIVARQVLGPLDKLQPGFIAVPLDIKEPLAITLLANSISLTPGTVSTELSADLKILYVHSLNVIDEADTIAAIKQRYETPLKEIFGC